MPNDNSYLSGSSAPFIEALYEEFLANPASVPEAWRRTFEEMADGGGADISHAAIRQRFLKIGRNRPAAGPALASEEVEAASPHAHKQAAVLDLIHAFRLQGHLRASTDMIDLLPLPEAPSLDYRQYGLDDTDLDHPFNAGTLEGIEQDTLRNILKALEETYTGPIGYEYLHINDTEEKRWLQQRIEQSHSRPQFEKLYKRYILEQLTAAEGIEKYLHTKYAGQKRFSLEGGEALIPLVDAIVQHSGSRLVQAIAIAMAHRGRLNVLTNIMGKAPKDLFMEFEGKVAPSELTSGDVRYHEGFSSDVLTPGGPMHLTLGYNPSHLEIIDPVILGSVRARQDRSGDTERDKVLAILIHGDAAIAGQGVVYESFSLSQTRGFGTGGSIHVVVNNRIGFTLSNPRDSRSTLYCTDVGKVVQTPIFHVNGDDPEAVVYAAQLAVDYRMRFHKDVIIDLICYRRHGHNEADEPAATQPMMYQKIRQHPGPRQVYADRLVAEEVITQEDADEMVGIYRDELDAGQPVSENRLSSSRYPHSADWTPFLNSRWTDDARTALSIKLIKDLGEKLVTIPEDLKLHPRVAKIMDDRRKMVGGALPMDWGCAENLAYASLLAEGYNVRITGQDSGRGTFFHRHSVVHNQRNGESYTPLEHVAPNQSHFRIIDSILSEEAVVGFEFGYSSTDPHSLVVWEAQFGDFVNVAQVVIDQFISSSEQKWRRLCGLVMMLPHGWEGQGPEHSSARLERFMQLCAQDNMQVCIPTTPAQMFHLLRRQMLRAYRKPLIIMTPKSTLRRKISFSSLEDLSSGSFQTVIGEPDPLDSKAVQRVVLCSGKVFYDILEKRREMKEERVALIRLEQAYPFPAEMLTRELRCFPNATEVVWTQEEPMNQGCWDSIQDDLRACIAKYQSLSYAGRLASAAPAGGYYYAHQDRQKRLIQAALNLDWTEPHPIEIFKPEQPARARSRN